MELDLGGRGGDGAGNLQLSNNRGPQGPPNTHYTRPVAIQDAQAHTMGFHNAHCVSLIDLHRHRQRITTFNTIIGHTMVGQSTNGPTRKVFRSATLKGPNDSLNIATLIFELGGVKILNGQFKEHLDDIRVLARAIDNVLAPGISIAEVKKARAAIVENSKHKFHKCISHLPGGAALLGEVEP